MVLGLIIKESGIIKEVEYKIIEDFKKYIKNFSVYKKLEIHELDNKNEYIIYGKTLGSNFNIFDLYSVNPTGDIVVIKTTFLGRPLKLTMNEFLKYYKDYEDLDDTLSDEEYLLKVKNEEYELNDFVVADCDNEFEYMYDLDNFED